MGCFLGCFGFSSKRKRRKQANRVQPGEQRFGSYEPLDSASANLDVTEKPLNLDSELKAESRKPKEPFNYKIRKKVSFNLNVQTYEPIPKEEDSERFSDDEGSSKETEKERESQSLSDGDSTAEKMASYPSNYRYRNCIHSYDEEDEIAFEESDLDDEDYDDLEEDEDDYDDDTACLRVSQQEQVYEKFKSLSVNRDSLTELNGGEDRSEYVHSVLKPVENLSQWKAVKAKAMPLVKRQRKENIALEQEEIAVDASLSNWLGCESNKNISSCSWRSREDMPILDFTSLEA
ncbi:uncharacterized protein [Euphorbia lathyris]|uniref:uncharacterized protein isoform X2 n=1 Tax=Euphorbia lathyris TaxID=212925 RepID=UPI0033137859